MFRPSILLACVLLSLTGAGPSAQTSGPVGTARVLVLPFESAGSDPASRWLGEASAVLVADGLRARSVPAISRDERVRAFEELHLPLSVTLSRATVIKVAQLLGAVELVTGTIRVQDRQLTVEAHTIRVDAGRVRPTVTESGPLTDLFALHDRLVTRAWPESVAPASAGDRPPLGAFENYIKGLLAESPAAKATFLETALQDYPAFHRARLSLWEVRTDQGDQAAALAAARLIPATSPLYARARFCAATSMLNLQRYDEAFETLTALAVLPPGEGIVDPPMRGAIQNNLGVIQIRRGGSAQAGTPVYFLTKATEADPADADYLFNLGYAYMLDRNYQATVYWLREALRRDPADADAHVVLAAALQAGGSSLEAGRERDLARQLSARYEDSQRAAADRWVAKGMERVQADPDGSSALRATAIVGTVAQRDQRELAAFHLERGRRLFEREQDSDALTELRRAVYLSPYEAQAHLLIGRIHLRGDDGAVDVAAMAPGTHIGAAHPVSGDGEKVDEVMAKKMTSDVAGYARSLATQRGRNVSLVEQAVTESKTYTDQEALAAQPPLIDLVASDVPDLLRKLDGRTVKRFDGRTETLHTAGAVTREVRMTQSQRLLSALAHPQIAYLLLMLGTLGLTIELWSPGAILPGVAGGICLLLAFFAFQVLPVSTAGVLLILFGVFLLILEVKVTSFGLLGLGGALSLLLGSMMLVDSPLPELQVGLGLIVPVSIGIAGILLFLVRLVVKARRLPTVTGAAGMVEERGEALSSFDPGGVGRVRTHGEIWTATADVPIHAGDVVRVLAVEGLLLTVEPLRTRGR